MIKAIVSDDRHPGPMVVLGLSGENVTRLVAGEPILIDLAQLGLPPQRVSIVYGKTEEAIVAELKTHLGKILTHVAPETATP